jgi:phosphoglycolate phosphatase
MSTLAEGDSPVRTRGAHVLADDVEHVIWDWNGTLLDDHAHSVSVTNAMLRAEGLPETDAARARLLFDFPAKRYYERLGFDLAPGRWEKLAAIFIESYDLGVEVCALHVHAREVLVMLQERGRKSSILSAARKSSIEPLLERHGIGRFFTDVVGLDDHYAHGKVELGMEWLRSSAIPRERTVLIGDTVHDYEVARAMDVRCVLFAGGHHARERLEQCGCPVVDRLEELV